MSKNNKDKKKQSYTPAQIMALKSSVGPRATEAFTQKGQKATGLAPARNNRTVLSSQDRMGSILRAGDIARRVAYEVSGAGDVERFVKNPSRKTAGMLGLTVAAYAGGPALKSAIAGRAVKAGLAAEKTVLATKAAKVAAPIEDKVLKFAKTTTSLGMPSTKGKLISRSDRAMDISGWAKATTPKNVNRVQAGRAAAVNIKAEKEGLKAASEVFRPAASTIRAAQTAGFGLASAKAASTASLEKKKRK